MSAAVEKAPQISGRFFVKKNANYIYSKEHVTLYPFTFSKLRDCFRLSDII